MSEGGSEQKSMDPQQLKKMSEVLSHDLRKIKQELEEEKKEKARIAEEQKAREEEYARMKEHMDRIREEKKQYYSGIIDQKVKPYFEDLRKNSENDARMTESIARFEKQLDTGLNDAFMDPDQLATLQVAVAASAANQMNASKLEELFQSQKQWEEKFGAMQSEKEALAKATEEAKKQLDESNALKDKMVEDLKKELAELRAKHEKSINNVEGHFEEGTDVKMEDVAQSGQVPAQAPAQTTPTPVTGGPPPAQAPAQAAPATTVQATASKSHFYKGFETLFDFTPGDDWRTKHQYQHK